MAGEADSVSSVSASACHIYRPNSLNPGQGLVKNIVGYKDVIFALHGWPRIASKPSRSKVDPLFNVSKLISFLRAFFAHHNSVLEICNDYDPHYL